MTDCASLVTSVGGAHHFELSSNVDAAFFCVHLVHGQSPPPAVLAAVWSAIHLNNSPFSSFADYFASEGEPVLPGAIFSAWDWSRRPGLVEAASAGGAGSARAVLALGAAEAPTAGAFPSVVGVGAPLAAEPLAAIAAAPAPAAALVVISCPPSVGGIGSKQ